LPLSTTIDRETLTRHFLLHLEAEKLWGNDFFPLSRPSHVEMAPCLLLIDESLPLKKDSQNLLDKMIAAIEMKATHFDFVNGNSFRKNPSYFLRASHRAILSFGPDMMLFFSTQTKYPEQENKYQDRPVTTTYNPGHLIRHPEDKALAWKALQSFRTSFSLD
jgi:hypothetical protein